ncbi:MAG TPA: EAL domain-containing protein [Micromonosporaceae bacterium]|nr:EAL domain-containing protein [Micromonosporaceae bacterium]
MVGFAILVALAAVFVVGAALMIAAGPIAPVRPLAVVGFVVAAAFASWFMPHLRVGGSRHGQSLTDVAIIFGLMTLPWPWVVVAIAIGTPIGKTLSRFSPGRVAFSAAKDVVTVAVAAAAGGLSDLASPFQTTSDSFGRIVIVALIAIAVDEAITMPALALASGQPARDIWAEYAPVRLTSAIVRMGCGIATGYLVHSDPPASRLTVAVPLLAIALQLAYANRLQQRVDRLTWARLSQLVDVVSTGDAQTVRLAAVHGTAELFACAQVDLLLRDADGTDVLIRGDARTITYVGSPGSAPAHVGTQIVAPLGGHDPGRGPARSGLAADDGVPPTPAAGMPPTPGGGASPTPGGAMTPGAVGHAGNANGSDEPVGELRLRFLMPVKLTDQEQHTLQALAAALGTAIRKANSVSAAARMATDRADASTKDPLTGLANRWFLLERGLATVRERANGDRPTSVGDGSAGDRGTDNRGTDNQGTDNRGTGGGTASAGSPNSAAPNSAVSDRAVSKRGAAADKPNGGTSTRASANQTPDRDTPAPASAEISPSRTASLGAAPSSLPDAADGAPLDPENDDRSHDEGRGGPAFNDEEFSDDGRRDAAATPTLVALAVVDLHGFKQVNDALGQRVGDQVLVAVAQRLAGRARPGDLIARLGGGEFAALLTPVESTGDAVAHTRDILAAIAQPLTVDAVRLDIAATAGVAVDTDTCDVGELLRRADVAVQQAKLEGQPIATYAPTRDTADVMRLALGADLTRAVARREFTIAFQPIVELDTGMVRSAEALARWQHPQLGQLSPHQFLDGIERSGLLAGFTEDILDQALVGARSWVDAGFEVPVAVNVSPRSLLDARFPDRIEAALDRYHLAPNSLIIELTETLILSHLGVVDEVLQTLRELGVMLALDDFGTGYSSLATVARVPVDELKIDRSFISGLAGPTEGAIVRSTIELGRSLGITVVAEGIESTEQRDRLWALGCAAGQGHLFSRAVAADRLIARLRRGHDGVPGRLVAPLLSGDVIRLPRRQAEGGSRDELN